MPNLSLRPDWIVYPKIAIEANDKYDSSKPLNDQEYELRHRIESGDKELYVSLHAKTPEAVESNLPYKIEVHIYAVFSIGKNLKSLSKKLANEILVDITNLLVGSIRETVTTITARSPWGAYIIPFIKVEEIAKRLLEDVKAPLDDINA